MKHEILIKGNAVRNNHRRFLPIEGFTKKLTDKFKMETFLIS